VGVCPCDHDDGVAGPLLHVVRLPVGCDAVSIR
jgi:hypothetical protein